MKTSSEIKIYGFNACMELWRKRPHDVLRVYIEKESVKSASRLLKWCAANRKPYHILPSEEMERVADSVHHEGICLLTSAPDPVTLGTFFSWLDKQRDACLLYLDGVQNPHNVGSIVRACAHFGVAYILGDEKILPKLSPSMCRIAQGGMEHVDLLPLSSPANILKQLQQKGYRIITTSSHGGKNLYSYTFPARSLIVMGAEDVGVSKSTQALAQDSLLIPGSGLVESLNVSVATGLLLGEFWRQRHS